MFMMQPKLSPQSQFDLFIVKVLLKRISNIERKSIQTELHLYVINLTYVLIYF